MITTTRYIADDGSEWLSADEARRADAIHAEIEFIMAGLPKQPHESGQRIPIDPEVGSQVKRMIVSLCRRTFPTEKVFQNDPKLIHPMSYAGRFISELPFRSLNSAWHWLLCLNDGWLYQQPFYASNPDKWIEEYGPPKQPTQ